ncbi:MAG: M28 family peptidase, partial [Hymenobacteraceae bacterium]|nr:M28 family peptidase [Hymenobacteraceae bacterium]MDX5396369.1 M28 family peptidase [Hymenobacteraceae bacterium]MDX5512429.1 M28 family peptidase [Hymenobacteraceae bacterium]
IHEPTYSDYKGLDVTGKAVVILAGEPKDKAGKSIISKSEKPSAWANDWKKKLETANEMGATNVFIIPDTDQKAFEATVQKLSHWLKKPSISFPKDISDNPAAAFFVSPEMGAALLDTKAKKIEKYKNRVAKKGQPQPGRLEAVNSVKVKAAKESTHFLTENVLGYLEGTDLKDEVIVITAHYDHLGVIENKIHYGADDDGSGTVALLELAQAFAKAKKDGYGPRRSLLFMAVTGEEHGLLGSEYYTDNAIFPIENTVANLNIDMIGRVDNKHPDTKEYVYIIGSDKLSSDLHEINEKMNEQHTNLDLDYTYNDDKDPNRFYYRSDHYNFARYNVPVIFYFSGVHEDYHRHTDTVDKILFDKMAKIVKLVFHTAWDLANRDSRIEVNRAQ